MKALTIEEIKQFETGYFIYIVVIYEKTNSYYKIDKINNENLCLKLDDLGDYAELPFSEYGKTWLAYRNKEYAECKGELVELICKLDDTIYVPWNFDGVSSIAELKVVFIEINKLHNNYITNLGEITDMSISKNLIYFQRMKHGVYSEQDFNKVWFTDKKLAEQKLKEL